MLGRGAAFGLAIAVAVAACSRSTPDAPDAAAAALDAAPRCDRTITITAALAGSFVGDAIDANVEPRLVVSGLSGGEAPPDGVLATVRLAAPYFGRDVALDELCSDDGSTASALHIACIVPAEHGVAVRRLEVRVESGALVARGDAVTDHPAPRPLAAGTCAKLTGLGRTLDLDAIAATWGKPPPSDCAGPTKPVDATLELAPPPAAASAPCTPGSKLFASASVRLRVPAAGIDEDLGQLANQCGGLHLRRFTNANAVAVSGSDMGISSRFVYQLGDRIYFTKDPTHVASAALPCGVKARFVVRSPMQAPIAEQPGPIE